MKIRFAKEKDIDKVDELLFQVNDIHAQGRPDLFLKGGRKYNHEQLIQIFHDEKKPVLVAVDDDDKIMGYAFCIFQNQEGHHSLTSIKTLYLDDLCVDNVQRGKHVGYTLYHAVLDYAKAQGCYNVTLNVWTCNPSAMKFYEAMNMKPQKIGMEQIL